MRKGAGREANVREGIRVAERCGDVGDVEKEGLWAGWEMGK